MERPTHRIVIIGPEGGKGRFALGRALEVTLKDIGLEVLVTDEDYLMTQRAQEASNTEFTITDLGVLKHLNPKIEIHFDTPAATPAAPKLLQPSENKEPENMKKTVQIDTTLGNILVELDAEKAPKSVANFLKYVEAGHYDGTIFHRVIPGFMIQGGGFTPATAGMDQKPTKGEIENEANNGLKNVKYSLAMARTSAPHSATAQFFINVADNKFLNHSAPTAQGWGYAVFGQVIGGQDVIDAIGKVQTGRLGFHDDVPKEPVVMTKVSLVVQPPVLTETIEAAETTPVTDTAAPAAQ